MTQSKPILTQSLRAHPSRAGGPPILIQHTYHDEPSSLDTWLTNTTIIAQEFHISVLTAHYWLFDSFPQLFDPHYQEPLP